MASPFDLTSFPGFKSFGIERDDVCDDDGAVFALQMSKKRSRREEGPYDAMLARLLDGAKTLLADEEEEEYRHFSRIPLKSPCHGIGRCHSHWIHWKGRCVDYYYYSSIRFEMLPK